MAVSKSSMAAYARRIVKSDGSVDYSLIHDMNKFMNKRNRKLRQMKTIKDAKNESKSGTREEMKQIMKEDIAYCKAISGKVTNGTAEVLNESQVKTLSEQPRWAPFMREYSKRFEELSKIKGFLVEEAKDAQGADPCVMLMCTLKGAYEDIKVYHHMITGGDWLQDHELLADYYGKIEGYSDSIIELLMQYGYIEPTWGEVVQTVETVSEVTPVDADYAFYKVRDLFYDIIHWLEEVRNDEQLELSDGAKSEIDAKIYELELEADYKLTRRLAEVDNMVGNEVASGQEGADDAQAAQAEDGGDDAQEAADGGAAEAEAEAPKEAIRLSQTKQKG